MKLEVEKHVQKTDILQRAKEMLEEKIQQLEKAILEKTKEAKAARADREKMLKHLKMIDEEALLHILASTEVSSFGTHIYNA